MKRFTMLTFLIVFLFASSVAVAGPDCVRCTKNAKPACAKHTKPADEILWVVPADGYDDPTLGNVRCVDRVLWQPVCDVRWRQVPKARCVVAEYWGDDVVTLYTGIGTNIIDLPMAGTTDVERP